MRGIMDMFVSVGIISLLVAVIALIVLRAKRNDH